MEHVGPRFLSVCYTLSSASQPKLYSNQWQYASPQQFIEAWAATFNENIPELLSAFYDQTDDLEVIICAGVRHHGYKAVWKAYADDFKSARFYDSNTIDTSTRILQDTAIITFAHKLKARLTQDNTLWQVHVRTTSALHRMHGEWKIVLEHSSAIYGTKRSTQIQDCTGEQASRFLFCSQSNGRTSATIGDCVYAGIDRESKMRINQIIGPNSGRPRQFPIPIPLTAHVGQLRREL